MVARTITVNCIARIPKVSKYRMRMARALVGIGLHPLARLLVRRVRFDIKVGNGPWSKHWYRVRDA